MQENESILERSLSRELFCMYFEFMIGSFKASKKGAIPFKQKSSKMWEVNDFCYNDPNQKTNYHLLQLLFALIARNFLSRTSESDN